MTSRTRRPRGYRRPHHRPPGRRGSPRVHHTTRATRRTSPNRPLPGTRSPRPQHPHRPHPDPRAAVSPVSPPHSPTPSSGCSSTPARCPSHWPAPPRWPCALPPARSPPPCSPPTGSTRPASTTTCTWPVCATPAPAPARRQPSHTLVTIQSMSHHPRRPRPCPQPTGPP